MEERFADDGKIHDAQRLKELQSLPLDRKVGITIARIIEWYKHFDGKVYVAFSGGKDSTVLLHIARGIYPDIPAVFVDTGLEYPEVRSFAKSFPNVTVLKPKMRFDEVIKKVGYPIISKEVAHVVSGARVNIKKGLLNNWTVTCINGERLAPDGSKSRYNQEKYKPLLDVDFAISERCCSIMKKEPSHRYSKETGSYQMTAMIAEESLLRQQKWVQNGCNAFNTDPPSSQPMAFWTEQDVLQYLDAFSIPIASVYGDIVPVTNDLPIPGFSCPLKTTGCDRTGCIFCGFGLHREKGITRFQRLKETHPKQYKYCIEGGEYDIDGCWKPNKEGLGMRHVFEELNKIYGDDFIRFE